MFRKFYNWMMTLARVFRRELNLSLTDMGALMFFVLLPLAYPIVYTIIYNPETPKNIPVAVVDDCRTQSSRELVRMIDATEAIKVMGYASDMQQARRWKDSKECYAVIHIPHNYARTVGRGGQSVVEFYCDMTLLFRYRQMLLAMTGVQLAEGAKLRTVTASAYGAGGVGGGMSAPVDDAAYVLGDTQQGFASFVIPGIIVLILQQSMLLGITLLGGTRYERRVRGGGIDPMGIDATSLQQVVGRALCYVMIYLPLTLYVLHYVPVFFSLPHIGSPLDYIPYIFPMLLATAFMGIAMQLLVREREMSMMVIVFTSVIVLFLSGLTWPRYAMPWYWRGVGDMIPAVWGMEGFIRINSNGASLAAQRVPYLMMWALTAFYFFAAWWATWYTDRKFSRRFATATAPSVQQ